jgi:hypothetical protein
MRSGLLATLLFLGCVSAPLPSSDALLCSRAVDGLRCAEWRSSSFGEAKNWSRDFSDAAGWAESPSQWATLQMVDLDGNGFNDVCGRNSRGIVCALRGESSFGPSILSPVFTDADGFADWTYASTLQWVDANGDRRPDVCAAKLLSPEAPRAFETSIGVQPH